VKEAHIVVDLTYGDAGKGTIVDYLARARQAHTVIRFNGGAQAGHNVVAPDGRHHTFSQFGAATFVPGVRTFLSRHMIISPLAMIVEAERLAQKGVTDAFERASISAEALVVTPFQRAANRLREISRGEGRHGSCGMGIGETAADALLLGRTVVRAEDLFGGPPLERKLRWMQEYKRGQMRDTIERCRGFATSAEEIAVLEDPKMPARTAEAFSAFSSRADIVGDGRLRIILAEDGATVFEGAQGVLIDEWRGFDPYTTWSTCTFDNALGLLKEHGYDAAVERVGVLRAYGTRHGPGPFVTEDPELEKLIPDAHNRMDDWQRQFRIGWFDAVAHRYAIAACGGVDSLAVTCFDRLEPIPAWRICTAYGMGGGRAQDIRLGEFKDLAYQRALTAELSSAKPIYELSSEAASFDERVEEHVGRIEGELGARVAITSFGPSAGDKKDRRS
jgi:adenylosuccinate synthase